MTEDDDVVSMLRDSAVGFLAAQHRVDRLKGHIGEPRAIDRAVWAQMAGMGWLGLALDEALGGSGMGVMEAAALCEVFGQQLFPEPFIAAALMPAVLLNACGVTDRSSALSAGLNSGELRLAVAWQEGRDDFASAPRTTTLAAGRLNGVKHFVTAVEPGSVLLVSALADGLPVWLELPSDAAGVRIERRASGAGSLSTVHFTDVPVSSAPLCSGERAAWAGARLLDTALVCASAYLAGVAQGCLDKTVAFVNERVQFDHPLSAFQTVAHRCVDLLIETHLADAAWRHAAARLAKAGFGAAPAEVLAAISAGKARCGDAAQKVGRVAVQLHGGMGFTEEADIGLYLRAALQHAAWLGNGTAQRRRFMAARSAALQESVAHD